jgi:hypothetical protein
MLETYMFYVYQVLQFTSKSLNKGPLNQKPSKSVVEHWVVGILFSYCLVSPDSKSIMVFQVFRKSVIFFSMEEGTLGNLRLCWWMCVWVTGKIWFSVCIFTAFGRENFKTRSFIIQVDNQGHHKKHLLCEWSWQREENNYKFLTQNKIKGSQLKSQLLGRQR